MNKINKFLAKKFLPPPPHRLKGYKKYPRRWGNHPGIATIKNICKREKFSIALMLVVAKKQEVFLLRKNPLHCVTLLLALRG